MSNDLVKRLREDGYNGHNPLCLEAADHIEKLEDALTAIAAECWVPVRSDAEMCAAWRKLATERVDIARKVMGISHE